MSLLGSAASGLGAAAGNLHVGIPEAPASPVSSKDSEDSPIMHHRVLRIDDGRRVGVDISQSNANLLLHHQQQPQQPQQRPRQPPLQPDRADSLGLATTTLAEQQVGQKAEAPAQGREAEG